MTAPRPRAVVEALHAYVPGRPPAPRPGVTSYKLSSNENPYPPLPAILDAATARAERMNRYPDAVNAALYAALAGHLGVETDRLVAATGSVALLYDLVRAYCDPGDEVVYAWRSFEAYPLAVAVGGARSVEVPLAAGARHDLAAMADAVTERTRVIIVCTPNNPTGPAVGHAELKAFLDRVPPRVLVVVDEAYLEFVRAHDPVDGLALAAAHDNVLLTRTFSKAYGLAGLRVGYGVAHPDVAAALRAVAVPFGVSAVAQAAAVAALAHTPGLLARVDALVAERDRVVAGVRAAGWEIPDAQGNFCWFPAGNRTDDLASAAEALGLSVRPFAGEGVRISIGEPEANDRIVELARSAAPAHHRVRA